MKTKRKIQIGSVWTRRYERRLGFRVWRHFRVLLWWVCASTDFSRKDGFSALRPQRRIHRFKTGICRDFLYINIVNVQITNLVVERKIFAEKKQERLAEQRIQFSQFKDPPTYLSFLFSFVLVFLYVSKGILTWYIFVYFLLSHNSQKEDDQVFYKLYYKTRNWLWF